MSVISGIGGHAISDANIIECIRTWGVSYNAGVQEAVCSATKGGRLRMPGNKDWTGQYTAYGHTPLVLPGEEFTFKGAITGIAAAAVGVSGDAIVDSVQINWDMEAGTILNHQVNFGAMSALTFGSINVADDTSIPEPVSASGLIVKTALYEAGGAAGALMELHEVRTATLTLTRNNPSYVSSGTGGNTYRFKGNFDVALALSCYAKDTDGWDSFPKPNEAHAVELYVNDTDAWFVKWIMFNDMGGMDVDVEGAALVGCSLSGSLAGFWDVSGTWTTGVVETPADAQVWPE